MEGMVGFCRWGMVWGFEMEDCLMMATHKQDGLIEVE